MARPLRIEFPGACYFVTSRGNASERVFLDSDDGKLWMDTFESVCSRFGWICYAYCLMDNHYHIVVETPRPNLSAGMRQLNGVFTQAFNRRHKRGGHVFMGRFKSIVFQKEKYLKPLIKHVVLNPVRKGIITAPSQWKWSSCRASCGGDESVAFIDTKAVAGIFGGVDGFKSFVSDGNYDDIRSGVKGQIYLGDEIFVEKTAALASSDSKEIPLKQRTGIKPSRGADRNEAIISAFRSGSYSMKEISDLFGVHYSTVSRILSENDSPPIKLKKTG
ncbi:MAG: transposase [Thermodesulfobacteriota bacterium]